MFNDLDAIYKEQFVTRFLAKISKFGEDGCWPWSAAKDPYGYGRVNINGRVKLAHRVSWHLFKGDIPEGKILCHTCDNPSCVNPSHLYPGDFLDNGRDMVDRLRCEHGERHHGAHLTSEEIRQIRVIEGVYQKEIAALYGISQPLVSMIRSRKTRRFEA